MSSRPNQDVAVIVAVRNAEATIALAVSSALGQTRTAEVIVVDDASTDRTAEAARGADDGTGRLKVLSLDAQAGPSRARNMAIAASRAGLIAVLDGDDVFLPGRFDWLLQDDGWDFIADNIVMYRSADARVDAAIEASRSGASAPRPALDLSLFVEGNISGSRQRKELGFLKPVMRRDFLERAGLRYNEAIRFAEDYELYCRALIAGARFKFDARVGYGALVHSGSLSATHSGRDLGILVGVDQNLLGLPGLDPRARHALKRHLRQISSKYRYRMLLDRRKSSGLASAVLGALAAPASIPEFSRYFFSDKLRTLLGRFRDEAEYEPALLVSSESSIISR